MSSSGSIGDVDQQEIQECASMQWHTVIWDDDVNLDIYVIEVLQRHFSYAREEACGVMLRIRAKGACVVSRGPRERMEADATSMHAYGLKATLEPETC